MALTDDDVREILRIVAETPLAELSIETEGFSLYVRRGAGADTASRTAQQGAREPAPAPSPTPEDQARETPGSTAQSGDAGAANGLVTIDAPMLGTFYRAEGPGRPPYVEIGSAVEPDTTVCIIEVMKMMNSVPAGVAGTIAEVCEENARLVEYGQPLFRVRPA